MTTSDLMAHVSMSANPVNERGSPCWVWVGTRSRDGYGQAYHMGRHVGAHRISYILHNGGIPPGMWVLHRCDNRPCCNPDHLFLGTPLDNMRDMIEKGRARHPHGTSSSSSKFTEAQVLSIRADGRSSRAVAADYGVNHKVIVNIRSGKTYRTQEPT